MATIALRIGHFALRRRLVFVGFVPMEKGTISTTGRELSVLMTEGPCTAVVHSHSSRAGSYTGHEETVTCSKIGQNCTFGHVFDLLAQRMTPDSNFLWLPDAGTAMKQVGLKREGASCRLPARLIAVRATILKEMAVFSSIRGRLGLL